MRRIIVTLLTFYSGRRPDTLTKDKLWTAPFLCMGGINFFQFLTQYILVTTLPLLIILQLGGNEVQAGLAMTFFQAGSSIFRPLAGLIIDRKNKRRILLLALLLFALIMASFNFVFASEGIFVLRFIHGIIFSFATTTATAIAVLVIPASRRGEGIGYFSVTTNLAMVIGPLAGLLLYNLLSSRALFLVLTVAAAAMLVSTALTGLSQSVVEPKATHTQLALSQLLEKKSLPASFLGGLVYFAYGGILTFIPLYMRSLHMADQTGVFFAIFALTIVASRPLIGRMFDRLGSFYVIIPGFIFFLAGLVLFSRIESLTLLYAAGITLGLGFGALSPAFQTLAIQSVPPSRAGAATATYFWFLDIFIGLAAASLGFVAHASSYAFVYGVLSPLIVIMAAFCFLLFHYKSSVFEEQAEQPAQTTEK